MKKTLVTLLLALVMVLGMALSIAPDAQAAQVNGTAIDLLYDDRKDLAELLGATVTTVEITNQTVKSTDVDGTADEAVLVYEDGTLYAVGIGTATLTVDGTAYTVTVSAAPISVFLITGHSVGYGQYGDAGQSVAIEPGQAYSSWWRDSLTSAEGGIGYGANVRAGGTGEYAIDAFDEGQNGTRGVGSALAYNWNKATGEKVWVMNLAVPGSCINEWLPGVTGWHYDKNGTTKYMYKYESIQEHFGYLQTILSNEIAAGHYTLGHIGMMYFSGANFTNANYTDWTYDSLKSDYATFWEGIKKDMAKDIDGDGTDDTFDSMGIVPLWTASNQDYRQDKLLNYYMAASADYPDVYIASDVYRTWAAGELDTFPAIDYTTQGTAVAVPTSVSYSESTPNSVFCTSDNTHLSQVTYNAVGLDMAANANAWYTNTTATTDVELRYLDNSAVPDSIQVNNGMTSAVMTPVVAAGARGNVTLTTTGNVKVNWPMYIEGTAVGTGTVTAQVNGTTVDSVAVEVLDKHTHCACGSHASGMTNHTCSEIEYQAWGTTDAEKTSLPTSGNYYLVADITLTASTTPTGNVNLCLNGHNITATGGNTRIYYPGAVTISFTDCGAETDWGTISSAYTNTYGGMFYMDTSASSKGTLNLYAGNFDGSQNSVVWGGVVLTSAGSTLNIYKANLIGGLATRRYVSASQGTRDGRGAAIYVMNGTANIYGGTITGGRAQNQGGNIYIDQGTLNIYGGTISGGKVDGSLGDKTDGKEASGGNLAIERGTVNFSGGTITGGTSTKGGGNICVHAYYSATTGKYADGTLNISGGTISGGTATTNGGNIVVYNATNTSGTIVSAGVLNISGGTITTGVAGSNGGNIHMVAGTTCTMTGGTVMAGQAVATTDKQGGNINITGAGTLDLSGGTVSDGIAGGYGGNICGTPGAKINISGTAVVSGGATGITGAGTSGAGGNIFGGGGTTLSTITISGGTISGGKALTGGNIHVDGKATISGGTIKDGAVPTGNSKAYGGNIYTGVRTASTLTITGGTISGGVGYRGGSIATRINTTISGGTISGGRAYYCGGNIYLANTADTTLTITGDAVIKDGKARYLDTGTNATDYPEDGVTGHVMGGNIYIYGTTSARGNAVISGGTISGGVSNCGGNIYCAGDLEISGGTITKGYARGNNACGANLYQDAVVVNKVPSTQITMTGGLISEGYADSTGGNMQIHGNFTMTGGELLKGSAGSGGNVRVFRPGNFVLDGGTVTGGTSRNLSSNGGTGGNVFQVVGHEPTTSIPEVATLTIKSGTITGSTSNAVNGGTILISQYGVVNVEGGTINGGTAQDREWKEVNYPGRGGVFCMYATTFTKDGVTTDRPAVLNISGGTITGGTADSYGGIIAATKAAGSIEINISGGTISGGKAIKGGILWTEDDCTVNITGGTFTGGEATDGGLFWLGGGANVTISGGTIDGGTATGKGDGIYVVDATLTIKDDAQLNGAGTNLYVENTADTAVVTFENTSDKLIVVDAADKTAAFASSAADCSAAMPCADEGYKVVWADGKLSFAENAAGSVAAVYEGTDLVAKYPAFDGAAQAAMDSVGYVKLLGDTESAYNVTGTLWVDLAGFDLSGITVSGTLYGMDSTTDGYSDANVGTLTCTVSGEGKVATNCKSTSAMLGAIRRYMTIPGENNTYTFHRFYMGITKITMKPATVGIGYKAVFAGSDTVKNYMTGFGYSMWVDEDNKVVKTMGADQFVSKDEVTLRIDNIMTPGNYEQNVINAEIDIYGSVFVDLITGEKLESACYVTDFHQVVETIDVQYADFTETQKQAIIGLHTVYHQEMIGWDIPDLHHGEGTDWVAVDAAGFNALLVASGSRKAFAEDVKIYLTEDVNLTVGLNILGDQNISICLNGHTIHDTVRVFNLYGTLNIYDCCDGGSNPGQVTSDYTSYGPIMYTYKGSVMNLYGGELVGTTTTPGGGVVVIGNDSSTMSTSTADSVFNMYGGKIYGGTSTGSGGNITTFHGGQFNMYGGEIFGGNATSNGGNIYASSGTNDTGDFYVNIYGGKIYDGIASGNGGNIYGAARVHINIAGGQITGGVASGNGGNIYAATTELAISGGTVSNGTAKNGGNIYTVANISTITGGTIKDGTAVIDEAFDTTYNTGGLGGNIYLAPASTATDISITGGTITGGKATDGGNVYIRPSSSAAVVNIENVTLSGGEAEHDGGNLAFLNYGTVNLNNVTVTDGVAGNDGANIYLFRDMNQANFSLRFPTMNVNGGKIVNGKAGDKGSGLYVQESILNLSGNVQLTGNEGTNLYLDASQTVTLKDLAETAKIGVSMNLAGTVSADTAYVGSLTSDDSALNIETVDGAIKMTGGLTANVPELTGYSVGWYRGDITPQWPVPLDGMGNNYGRMAYWDVKTELMAGFTVIADETGIENAIILVSVDTLFIQKELADNLSATISEATGIPANRIFYSASHTHCGVDHDGIYEGAREYMESFYNIMTQYAVLAVEDLKPATIQTGSIDVVSAEGNSLNMARRYIGDDGNAYSSVDSASYPAPSGAERESASDTEMQLIRFVREGGTDVVMTNWQSHPSGYSSGTYGYVSAEHWKIFREAVESSVDDTVCTFFLGAAGNLGFNSTSALSSFTDPNGTTHTATSWTGKGEALAGFASYALNNNMTTVEPGELKVTNFTFETQDLYKSSQTTYKDIDLDLNAICIGGDIAFITAPYEMFHENGSQIKAYAESLGFETCFVLTNSMGENKYIGAYNSFENDNTDGSLTSFGVRTCRYIQGTAELLIDQFADMLAGLAGVEAVDTIYETYTVSVVDTDGNAIQNVMIQLVGGNDARNCTDADGTVEFYIYGGIDYAIELVKVPSGYAITDVQYTFDSNNQLTITLEAA